MKLQIIMLFFCHFHFAHQKDVTDSKNSDTEQSLERIDDIAKTKTGTRKLNFGSVNIERIECSINITSVTQPCSALSVLEDLFPSLDFEKLSGGFMSFYSMLINIKIDFAKTGQICNSSEGSIEVNINSTGRHVHIVDKKYLPLKIVFLQVIWDLSIKQLKTVDIELNGVFLSNTLGINSNNPNYEGVIIEIQKPKGLTIFEFKTVNLPTTELNYLLKDFYIDISSITVGLALKTKLELSLQTLKFYNSTLIGYIEPNIMFEFQLSGVHMGSNAYISANPVYVTIQKYHGALEPTVAIFGKFSNGVINTLTKVSVVELPVYPFLKTVKEHALVLSSEKISVINIKEAREASDKFYCKKCRVKFLPGLHVIFHVEDIKSSNNATYVSNQPDVLDNKEEYFAHLQLLKRNHIPNKLLKKNNVKYSNISSKNFLIKHDSNFKVKRTKRESMFYEENKDFRNREKLKRTYVSKSRNILNSDIKGYGKVRHTKNHDYNYFKRDSLKDLLRNANSIVMTNTNDEDDTLDSTIFPVDNINKNISFFSPEKNFNFTIMKEVQSLIKNDSMTLKTNLSIPLNDVFTKIGHTSETTVNITSNLVNNLIKQDKDNKTEHLFNKTSSLSNNNDILILLNESTLPVSFIEKSAENKSTVKKENMMSDLTLKILQNSMQSLLQYKEKNNRKIKSEDKISQREVQPFMINKSDTIMFVNVNQESLVFEVSHNSEYDVLSIINFVDPAILANLPCFPFNGENSKFMLNKISLTKEMLEINMNMTADTEVVPGVFSIKKSFCVTVQQTKEGQVSLIGTGKGKILETETKVELILDESKGCSVEGNFFWQNLEIITEKFGIKLFPNNFQFGNLLSLKVKHLQFSAMLTGEKFLRLNGEVFSLNNKHTVELESFIWVNKSSYNKEIALALTAKDYNFNDLLKCVYGDKILVPEWVKISRAAIVIIPNAKSDLVFKNSLLSQISFEPGVSFVGELARASYCENEITRDMFCQYINLHIPNFAGTLVNGLLKEDFFLLQSKPGSIITFSEDLYMLDPVFSFSYIDGKQNFIISGVAVLNIIGKNVKVKGKIGEHASGFPMLQFSGLSVSDFFQTTQVAFKPFLGSIMLEVSLDFRPVIDLLGSHINLGTSDQPIRLINAIGKIDLINQEESFFCGDIKDLTVAKILQAFSLHSKLNEVPVIKDAKFIGIAKAIYHDAKKDKKVSCLEETVSPGLNIRGRLRISASVIVSVHVSFNETTTGFFMQWEKKIFSKGLIQFKKMEEKYNDGPMLTSWIWKSPNQVSKTHFISYVVAIGMEMKNAEVVVERRLDGFLYFLFTMKGNLYNEINMIMEYKGSERLDDDFKVSGRVLDIRKSKELISTQVDGIFHKFFTMFNMHAKQSADMLKNVSMLVESFETSHFSSSGILNELVIKLKECEKKVKENILSIETDCADSCSRKPKIPIVTQQDFSSNDIGNLQIQIMSSKWAVNVSCVAACEVEKGIAFKKSQDFLISARNYYPQYEKQKLLQLKLEKFLTMARSIKNISENTRNRFEKESRKANKLVKKHEENAHTDWFEIHDIFIPEVAVSTLKGKLPCLTFRLRFSLYKEIKEINELVCLNGEFYENVAIAIFETLFTKSDLHSYFQSFDRLRLSHAKVMSHQNSLIKLLQDDSNHNDVHLNFDEVYNATKMYQRSSIFVFAPINDKKNTDIYEKDFKKLTMTVLPQYFVHSYKTSLVMFQKSPWAIIKTGLNPSSTSTDRINVTLPQDNDCVTYNSVVMRYSRLTNLLADLVDAYKDGISTYTSTRDNLVDSLHVLDSKITNEANRTYYTKGQLKDMIYWSVRVWKGVEDWVQDSTHQFEDHNKNAIALLTDQLDIAYGSDKTTTAADFIEYLSQVARNALKKLEIEKSLNIEKRNLRLKQEDHIQSIAITLSAFLRNKDISLDEASTRLPSLKSEIRELLLKVPQCDTPP
ncbi:uncharacterized protein LOC101235783 isoform X2 [Hydra vulgaris]|uniref:uncharacterized protein LOC101235783 isoform X2 n=1 Tax=Hydra vulgaris TaxID=6087 RepID=UPI001F5E7B39|nr:uncharacterized protein LOC101235783 isoform X2 [Hydra vulgaris]